MRDLDKALLDISAIKAQLAAGTAFRGYGPGVLALSGGLAFMTAAVQSAWLDDPTTQPISYFAGWIATALLSAALIGVEMVARTRRHHEGLADGMLFNAVEQFLPAGAVGALLLFTLWRFAPDTLWMMPGFWQILVGLGIFASVRTMPRSFALGGAWYVAAGFVVLAVSAGPQELSPWAMGLPFGLGQLLLAAIVHFASGEDDEEG
jgi:hypothetical protein